MSFDEIILDALRGAKVSGSKGWWKLTCPFCEDRLGKRDKRRSMGFLGGAGFYHCFRCGAAGKLDHPPDSFDPPEGGPAPPPTSFNPPEDSYPIGEEPGLSAMSLKPARNYLARRGVRRELAKEAGIWACVAGRYANRVIVPVLGVDGKWLGFSARSWMPNQRIPYLYPEGMMRDRIVFNVDALLKKTDIPVIIVEGVFDALALWPDAIAVLGKPSSQQIPIIAAAKRPIVVALDGDAWKEGRALSWRLQLQGVDARAIHMPPGEDPASVDKTWLFQEIQRCFMG